MNGWLRTMAVWAAVAYVADVLVRPELVARDARRAADAAGKPLLNVGAGTPGTSLRTAVLGPTLWGDVNVDIAAKPGVAHGRGVSYADAHRLPFADGEFGALIASHVVEHTDNPAKVLAEFNRVADQVFVVVPRWWAPHTWLHPGHKWYVTDPDAQGVRSFLQLRGARALPNAKGST